MVWVLLPALRLELIGPQRLPQGSVIVDEWRCNGWMEDGGTLRKYGIILGSEYTRPYRASTFVLS